MAKAQEGQDIQAMTDGQMFEELIRIHAQAAGEAVSSILKADIAIGEPQIHEMTVKEVPVSTRHAFLSSSPKAGELNVANDHAGVYTLDLSALLPKLENGEWKRILFVPTGALMSKVSFQEGSSVPGIAQAVVVEREEDV